jgi:hypothetical protein
MTTGQQISWIRQQLASFLPAHDMNLKKDNTDALCYMYKLYKLTMKPSEMSEVFSAHLQAIDHYSNP